MKPEDIFAAIVAALFVIALVTVGATSALILTWSDARAHQAPSGWEYDPRCCSGKDCAELPKNAVKAIQSGYHVYLAVGEHPMATHQPIDVVIPYDSHKIKPSPDGKYHGCFSQQYKNNAGEIFQNSFCLYVPPMGY
jgi:hypothetical protein